MKETMEMITLTVNGKPYRFMVGDFEGCIRPSETLLDTLRERLHLTAAKRSCDHGACGCCTVILDGDAVASCMTLTADCDGAAAGLCRQFGLPVRLLHAGHHHEHPGAADEEPRAHGSGADRSPFGQLLPVHQPLSGHPDGHGICREDQGGACVICLKK